MPILNMPAHSRRAANSSRALCTVSTSSAMISLSLPDFIDSLFMRRFKIPPAAAGGSFKSNLPESTFFFLEYPQQQLGEPSIPASVGVGLDLNNPPTAVGVFIRHSALLVG